MNADETADKVARAMLAAEGTGPAWGIEIEEAREGYARIRMRMRADMLNGHRQAHGGMVYALADTAFAYACNSRNLRTVGAQATMVFLDAAEEGEILIAEAQEALLSAAPASTMSACGPIKAEPLRNFKASPDRSVEPSSTWRQGND